MITFCDDKYKLLRCIGSGSFGSIFTTVKIRSDNTDSAIDSSHDMQQSMTAHSQSMTTSEDNNVDDEEDTGSSSNININKIKNSPQQQQQQGLPSRNVVINIREQSYQQHSLPHQTEGGGGGGGGNSNNINGSSVGVLLSPIQGAHQGAHQLMTADHPAAGVMFFTPKAGGAGDGGDVRDCVSSGSNSSNQQQQQQQNQQAATTSLMLHDQQQDQQPASSSQETSGGLSGGLPTATTSRQQQQQHGGEAGGGGGGGSPVPPGLFLSAADMRRSCSGAASTSLIGGSRSSTLGAGIGGIGVGGTGGMNTSLILQSKMTTQYYATKLEHCGSKKRPQDEAKSHLVREYKFYRYLQAVCPELHGFPTAYDCGIQDDFRYLVMDFLGPSLDSLFRAMGKRFTPLTVLRLSQQMISRLQFIHTLGILHRDIKPENFCMGVGDKAHIVHLLDFGLSKMFLDRETGEHAAPVTGKRLAGTARYASLWTHEGISQSRRDDLEGLWYTLLYFARGNFPWDTGPRNVNVEQYIHGQKVKAAPEQLLMHVDDSLRDFLHSYIKHVRSLDFTQEPDYDYLRTQCNKALKSVGANKIVSSMTDYCWFKKINDSDDDLDVSQTASRNSSNSAIGQTAHSSRASASRMSRTMSPSTGNSLPLNASPGSRNFKELVLPPMPLQPQQQQQQQQSGSSSPIGGGNGEGKR